jgi:hypothetical protein
MINGRLGFAVVGFGDAKRVDSIQALNIKFTGLYYPQNFAGNGDVYWQEILSLKIMGAHIFDGM